MKFALTALLITLVSLGSAAGADDIFAHKKAARPERLSMVAVWDLAHHASSPDLIRYGGHWLVAFREASSATSNDGAIRIMSSLDGEKWSPWSRLEHVIADLDKPRMHATPDGHLLLTAAVTMHTDGPSRHRTYGWKSLDGRTWEGPEVVGEEGVRIGPIEWQRGKAYSFGYQPGTHERTLRGYAGDGDIMLAPHSPASVDSAQLGQTGIAFLPDDTGLAVAEHAEGGLRFGLSRPPYRHWAWKDLGQMVSDPRLVRLDDGRLLVSGADSRGRSSLFWLNPAESTLTQAGALNAEVTGKGAAIRWHDGALWTVYQAANPNGAASIYLARIKLPAL